MSQSRQCRIGEGETVACRSLRVGALQDAHIVITAGQICNAADSRRQIRCIRLKLSALQCLGKRQPVVQSFINRICLIPVCDDQTVAVFSDGRIDDEAWIFDFRSVERLCEDLFITYRKYTISAVCASSHDEIGCGSFAGRRHTCDDSASHIGIAFHSVCECVDLIYIHLFCSFLCHSLFHASASSYISRLCVILCVILCARR